MHSWHCLQWCVQLGAQGAWAPPSTIVVLLCQWYHHWDLCENDTKLCATMMQHPLEFCWSWCSGRHALGEWMSSIRRICNIKFINSFISPQLLTLLAVFLLLLQSLTRESENSAKIDVSLHYMMSFQYPKLLILEQSRYRSQETKGCSPTGVENKLSDFCKNQHTDLSALDSV